MNIKNDKYTLLPFKVAPLESYKLGIDHYRPPGHHHI